mgnify:FL=1|tara:strand:+ start:750 stop:1178 length:429 start_codon:yes stop_codon:yes gene_type:complete
MIRYRLNCKNCDAKFDSWFASSKEYEKLKKLNHLNCHNCDSIKVEKTLMSPNVLNSKDKIETTAKDKKFFKIKNKIKKYQKFIKENFNYVGDNFAYEARAIHYNKDKKSKGIYGNSSLEEISELKDEGIETEIIPWFSENEN